MQKEVFMAPDGTLPSPTILYNTFWLWGIGFEMCGRRNAERWVYGSTWPSSSIRFKATRSSPLSPDGTKPSSVALLAGLNWRAWGVGQEVKTDAVNHNTDPAVR